MGFIRKKSGILFLILLIFGVFILSQSPEAYGQSDKLKSMVSSHEEAKEGMTMWQTLKTGGFIMFVLGLLSIGAVAIIVYNFMSLKETILTPQEFSDEAIRSLESGNETKVKALCDQENHILSNLVKAGLSKKSAGAVFVREAIENRARNEITKLWQNISYLADIAAVAPLVGLLGTVLGMIQAFNVIAFQSAVVKPMLLAGGVSKAMVTTAGGLLVAIPVMIFYAYFRGRVQAIADIVETFSTDLIKILDKEVMVK